MPWFAEYWLVTNQHALALTQLALNIAEFFTFRFGQLTRA